MSSDVGDHARYVLTELVDSLDRPYDAPDRPHTGLVYLSDGLTQHGDMLPAADRERLRARRARRARAVDRRPGSRARVVG